MAFVDLYPLTVLFSAEILLLLLWFGEATIWTRMKGVSFHVAVICRGRLERKVLLSTEELWEEGWFAADLRQKIQWQRRFCSRSFLDCEEVVAGRVSVAVQSRDRLPGFSSVPGLCGKGKDLLASYTHWTHLGLSGCAQQAEAC